jgi:type IV secretory pathway VirJ component
MKYKSIAVLLIIAFFFSSCSILLRERKIARKGIERNDFDLPVFVYPSLNPLSKRIVFLLSGDGGWIEFEDSLAMKFAKDGFNLVGFNSRTYFWEQKTPKQTAADLIPLINKYSALYKANRIYLAGYSFGADIVPFVYNLLPADIKRKITALEMLSPFASSDFDVHIINLGGDNYPYNVKGEVKNIKIPVYCFYGKDEEPKPLNNFKQKNFILKTLPGNHHYQTSGYQQIISSLDSLNISKSVLIKKKRKK